MGAWDMICNRPPCNKLSIKTVRSLVRALSCSCRFLESQGLLHAEESGCPTVWGSSLNCSMCETLFREAIHSLGPDVCTTSSAGPGAQMEPGHADANTAVKLCGAVMGLLSSYTPTDPGYRESSMMEGGKPKFKECDGL